MTNPVKTPVIPVNPLFTGEKKTLDLQAVCVFAALGFFLDDDTYYREQKVLKPARTYRFNPETGQIITSEPYFKWHYNPVERSLQQITEEFAVLFEQILEEQLKSARVILPLSGGLDSRTQAAALHYLRKEVSAYSYTFEAGHGETYYGKKIAAVCNFPLVSWKVTPGYLWDKIEVLARLNGCYSEFTHPRQMAFSGHYQSLGDVFSLGHWGDVLFDDSGVPDDLPLESQVDVLLHKIVKKGGMELASSLWKAWELEGDFEAYLRSRLESLLQKINIPESANAQIRAFKSLYWAPRWTSVNLCVFENERPVTLPYYHEKMCRFICSIPEKYLADRQIQIAYIKLRNPKLAEIIWQAQKPFNLYNYRFNKVPYNVPYRIGSKLKRTVGKRYTQRNWELQFIGEKNEIELEKYLFQSNDFKSFIPINLINHFYNKFKTENRVFYAHPVSMLLTLSLFTKQR